MSDLHRARGNKPSPLLVLRLEYEVGFDWGGLDVEWKAGSQASCGVIDEREHEVEGGGSKGFREIFMVAATARYHPMFHAARTGGAVSMIHTRSDVGYALCQPLGVYLVLVPTTVSYLCPDPVPAISSSSSSCGEGESPLSCSRSVSLGSSSSGKRGKRSLVTE